MRRPRKVHPLPRSADERGIEQGVRRGNLDLVVPARRVAAGIEEDLDDIRRVELLVVIEERARHVRILGQERDIQVHVVPQEARLGRGGARLSVEAADERPRFFGPVPVGLGEHAVDRDRALHPVDGVLGRLARAGARQDERDDESHQRRRARRTTEASASSNGVPRQALWRMPKVRKKWSCPPAGPAVAPRMVAASRNW